MLKSFVKSFPIGKFVLISLVVIGIGSRVMIGITGLVEGLQQRRHYEE